MIKVRIVFVKEFTDHHHFAIFQFDNRLQRHAFVVALANVADQSVGVAAVVDFIDAQIFRAQQNVQPLTPLDGEVDVDIAFAAFNAGADALLVKAFNDRSIKQINLADKTGDEQVFGSS